jgi:hypothetical protein
LATKPSSWNILGQTGPDPQRASRQRVEENERKSLLATELVVFQSDREDMSFSSSKNPPES